MKAMNSVASSHISTSAGNSHDKSYSDNRKKKKQKTELVASVETSSAEAPGLKEEIEGNVARKSAAVPSSTNSKSSSNSKKKSSPFRIKVGCLVALRHDSAGNNSVEVIDNTTSGASSKASKRRLLPNDSLVHVWADPVPGRDESLALVGKRIRCTFPKNLVQGKKRRVLEGEIVRLVDYVKRKPGKPWKVDLLIDRSMLEYFEFLTRVDEDVDLSQLNEKARRNHQNEMRIRGENKVIVKMRLQHPGSDQINNCVQWVIQKKIPAKLFQYTTESSMETNNTVDSATKETEEQNNSPQHGGDDSDIVSPDDPRKRTLSPVPSEISRDTTTVKENSKGKQIGDSGKAKKRIKMTVNPSAPRHVGDGNDPPEQQIANWRWLASRYHELSHGRGLSDELVSASVGVAGKVLRVEPAKERDSATLAYVTIQRVILPEYTITGRMPHHGKLEVFLDKDSSTNDQLVVPVEQLIVLGTSLSDSETKCEVDPSAWPTNLFASVEYVQKSGVFLTSHGKGGNQPMTACIRCFRYFPTEFLHICNNPKCSMDESGQQPAWCNYCLPKGVDEYDALPCCDGTFTCLKCRESQAVAAEEEFRSAIRKRRQTGKSGVHGLFGKACEVASASQSADFAISETFIGAGQLQAPAANPMKRVKTKGKEMKRFLRKLEKKNGSKESEARVKVVKEDYTVFKPSCARSLDYESQSKKKHSFIYDPNAVSTEIPRNLREYNKRLLTVADADDKTNLSRDERAKQRRMLKFGDIAALEANVLATRETNLSFGRSEIHGWGVFADRDINQGDMIVEYRGEIIGNATAEKREKEYEATKLGLDYMFRIDDETVCDATKLGNVARFINASCEPNCIAKIITVGGDKRIAIYAKNLIREREEICYDYKFPIECELSARVFRL